MTIKRETREDVNVTVEHEEVIIPVCDFCNQDYPEKDEDFLSTIELNPTVKGSKANDSERVIVEKDKKFDRAREMYEAIQKSGIQAINRSVKQRRGEVSPLVEEKPSDLVTTEFEINEDLVCYEFSWTTNPPEMENEGEMEVCEHCKNILFGD